MSEAVEKLFLGLDEDQRLELLKRLTSAANAPPAVVVMAVNSYTGGVWIELLGQAPYEVIYEMLDMARKKFQAMEREAIIRGAEKEAETANTSEKD